MKPDTEQAASAAPSQGARLDLIERAHLKEPGDSSHVMYRYEPDAEFDGFLQRFWIPVWSVPPGEEAPQRVLQYPVCLLTGTVVTGLLTSAMCSMMTPPNVVLGGTGHIGSATANALLRSARHVRVVTRSAAKANAWAARGAEPAVADIEDRAAMARVLSAPSPARVFALNPPGSIAVDPDADEDRTADAISEALATAPVERVVALSTYGAQPGHRIGDLGTLHRFEELLQALHAPVAIVRACYLYSNWDGAAKPAQDRGEVPVMLDPYRPLPMVAPIDVGEEAARLLMLNEPHRGLIYVEGPRRYTPHDVASIFASALGAPVETVQTPPGEWRSTFLTEGFSAAAADSFTGLTTLANRETWRLDATPTRGSTTLQTYIAAFVSTNTRTLP